MQAATGEMATGADDLVRTLVGSGVDLCLTNPGTSEMHFVAALDRSEGMRCVLALFEGVATGAADGFCTRMARRPAATLLHLGPGFANGFANLHNAKGRIRRGQRGRRPRHLPPRLQRAARGRHRGRGAALLALGAFGRRSRLALREEGAEAVTASRAPAGSRR